MILDDDGKEDFDALGNRIHPAESRIKMLAEKTPVVYRAFDLLAVGDHDAMGSPLRERRDGAGEARRPRGRTRASVELTPLSEDVADAQPWLEGGEGVIAKELDAIYKPGERKGMVKIKRLRTADAVVVGWRPGKEENTVGSLILGLYDGDELRVVGHTSGLSAKRKRELVEELKPYESGDRGSADPSRWAADRDLEWVGLRPELVVEITFDHVSADRIRHGSKIVRWREDKPAARVHLRPAQPVAPPNSRPGGATARAFSA